MVRRSDKPTCDVGYVVWPVATSQIFRAGLLVFVVFSCHSCASRRPASPNAAARKQNSKQDEQKHAGGEDTPSGASDQQIDVKDSQGPPEGPGASVSETTPSSSQPKSTASDETDSALKAKRSFCGGKLETIRFSITKEVGYHKPNDPADVQTVQAALNDYLSGLATPVKLKEDGIFGPKTNRAIRIYQARIVLSRFADGIVSPDGPTICSLNGVVLQQPPAPSSSSSLNERRPFNSRASPTKPAGPVSPAKLTVKGETAIAVIANAPSKPTGGPATSATNVGTAKPPSPSKAPAYKKAFLDMAVPIARALTTKYGVPVSVIVGQSALES